MRYQEKLVIFPYIIILLEIAVYLSNDMYLPSMPAIGADLLLTDGQTQATLTLWFLGSSALQVFVGPISDAYGRRHVLGIGALLFIVSSAVCALTHNYHVMLVARFVQGTVVGFVVVTGNAAIHESFDSKHAIKFLSIMGAITILAPALGPMVGALLSNYYSWRVIFWVLALLGVIALVLLICFMPETNHNKHKINVRKVIRDYLEILGNHTFMLLALCYSLLVGIFFFWMFETPFIMINVHGTTPLFYGVAQAVIFSGFFVGARFIDGLLERFAVGVVLRTFMLLVVFGVVLFVVTAYMYDSLDWAIACMLLVSVASSMLFGPINRLAIESSSVLMGRRTAIFSVLIGLLGSLAGWMLTVIKSQNLLVLGYMMLAVAVLAGVILLPMNLRIGKDMPSSR